MRKRRRDRAEGMGSNPGRHGAQFNIMSKRKRSNDDNKASKLQRTHDVDAFISANRNANTNATYSSGWRRFIAWVNDVENPIRRECDAVDIERPDECDVAAYMMYMYGTNNAKLGTITSAVAAISDHLRTIVDDTYANPCSGERVRRMKAVLIAITRPSSQKREITWKQLLAMHATTVKVGTALAERDSCMMILAYFAYLRVSEVVRMNREDITFTDEHVEGHTRKVTVMHVHVDRMAKNDAERKGHDRTIQARPKGEYCMVRQMHAYVATIPEGPLFPSVTGSRLSVNTPQWCLKRWLTTIGVTDPEAYGFHSMRAGAATDAAKAGVDERHIKLHGNWKSDAVRVYIRPDLNDRLAASNALGRA